MCYGPTPGTPLRRPSMPAQPKDAGTVSPGGEGGLPDGGKPIRRRRGNARWSTCASFLPRTWTCRRHASRARRRARARPCILYVFTASSCTCVVFRCRSWSHVSEARFAPSFLDVSCFVDVCSAHVRRIHACDVASCRSAAAPTSTSTYVFDLVPIQTRRDEANRWLRRRMATNMEAERGRTNASAAHATWMEGDGDDEEDEVPAEEARIELEAYERKYADERSWERVDVAVREHVLDEQRRRRQSRRAPEGIRRGLIRHLVLVVDCSDASLQGDVCFRPTRLSVLVASAEQYVREFFDLNPLSSMAVVCMRDGVAEAVTEMTSSTETHLEALRAAAKRNGGAASVQNALLVAQRALAGAPPYAKREAVLLLAAITSSDPGDIKATVEQVKRERIACSVVGAAAEVYLFKTLAKDTGGTYYVAKDETHFQQLVMTHATPPPSAPDEVACLVRMAFPRRNAPDSLGLFGRDAVQRRTGLKKGGYTCPQCKARVKELPAKCSVCEMTLISAPDLARSYHHLFPVRAFEEIDEPMDERCFGCTKEFHAEENGGLVLLCGGCKNSFCFECDVQIHESMFVCPGCEQGD